MNTTSDFRMRLAGRHSDGALRDAISRMRFSVRMSDFPQSLRNLLNDMSRRDGRNQHPAGRLPEVMREAAKAGAPLAAVLAPLTHMEACLTGEFYADRLPSITECQHTETNANRDFDHAQLAVAEGELTVAEIDEAEETGNTQIATTKTLLARLESLRSQARR